MDFSTRNIIMFMSALLLILLNTVIIMQIWNIVLKKAIKGADLQTISLFDAFAISIFFSMLSSSTVVITKTFD